MRTQLAPTLSKDADAQRAVEVIRKCVHCGFCNATCPTFRHFGDELYGPRGRIYLVKGLLERNESNDAIEDSLSLCLTCRACETTCPSGVEYGELAEYARTSIARQGRKQTALEKWLLRVVPNPRRFRTLYRLGRMFRAFAPASLKESLKKKLPPSMKPPIGNGPVVLLQGCVQRVLAPQTVAHLAKLLTELGIGFRTAQSETCCGALHLHLGHREEAEKLMRANIEGIGLREDERVVSTTSGCGTTLVDYGRHLNGEPGAVVFSNSFQDVSELLSAYEFKRALSVRRIAFQAPCSLQHGLKIKGTVERLLQRAGYELCPVANEEQCCGSAGSFSFLQPDVAKDLRRKKVESLLKHGPELIATANVGCQLHLEVGQNLPVKHWIELLECA